MNKIKVAIYGATGIIGQRLIQSLINHPYFKITSLISSHRNASKKYFNAVNWLLEEKDIPKGIEQFELMSTESKDIDADIIFSALPENIARTIEPKLAKKGYIISSNSSNMRLEKDIPLIIPEINPYSLIDIIKLQKKNRNWDGYIVKNPNCSAIILSLALCPLIKYNIKELFVSTMQSVSGAGYNDMNNLNIKNNIIPFIENEENKIEQEIKKIFQEELKNNNLKSFNIYSSCHRVPVLNGHLESVFIKFKKEIDIDKIKNSLLNFTPKIKNLPTTPNKVIILKNEDNRPQPKIDISTKNGMSIFIGRIRKGIRFEVLGHNTIRGGAGASILNAELLYYYHLI